MKTKTLFTTLILLSTITAQELLTPDKAVELALARNFLVQTEKYKADVANLSNTAGNAGMLPKAFATAAAGATLTGRDVAITPSGDSTLITTLNNVNGKTFDPAVTVTWTLFDGGRMFAEKSRLKKLARIGELNYKDTLQTVAAQTITAYYAIVSSVQQLAGLDTAIAVSQERVTIAAKQFQVGVVSKVDYLQAQLDLNEQKAAALAQEDVIIKEKAALNVMLGRSATTDFVTTDTIPVEGAPAIRSWADVQAGNLELAAAERSVDVAKLERQEAFAQFLPTLGVSGGYGLSYLSNSAGSALMNRAYGFNAGAVLTIPLFNGFNTLHAFSIADLALLNARVSLDNTRLQVEGQLYQARKDFEKAEESLRLEEANINIADENLKIAFARFRLAESTALEMRTAEQSFVDALTRLVNARFNAKAAETELLRIQGELVK